MPAPDQGINHLDEDPNSTGVSVSHLQRTFVLTDRGASRLKGDERQLWAVLDDGPKSLDLDGLRNGQSVLYLDTQIPNGAVHFGVT